MTTSALFISALAEPDIYPQLEGLFLENDLRLSNIETELNIKENSVVYRFVLTEHKGRIGRELSSAIAGIEGVQKIHFK